LTICQRLLPADVGGLCDYFAIPRTESQSGDAGREAFEVWDWLGVRDRLGELPKALEDVGRKDLAQTLTGD
jgi:hypothetical protein